MVALRSRRLQTLLGASLDELRYEHLEALVTNHVPEAFDLDFKRELYGNADRDKLALAADVAALANTAGGLIVLGIDEDEARAIAAPGVALSDAEITRILQIIGSGVVPLPVFDLLPVPNPGDTGHGFIVIAVARDALAPHAVIVNQGLRYPRRNGTTTRYLSEPEVASAYRDRLAGAQHQAAQIEEIEREALERLDTSDAPWVVVSLVPDLPGEMSINSEVFRTFRDEVNARSPLIGPGFGTIFLRASVGRRRLLADATQDSSLSARWLSVELHADGSGVCGICVPDLAESKRAGLPPEGGPLGAARGGRDSRDCRDVRSAPPGPARERQSRGRRQRADACSDLSHLRGTTNGARAYPLLRLPR